jgi:hypothetical protein
VKGWVANPSGAQFGGADVMNDTAVTQRACAEESRHTFRITTSLSSLVMLGAFVVTSTARRAWFFGKWLSAHAISVVC